jgi:hypothetical protein
MTPHEEPMNDAALESEIERLLSIDPSSGYPARIRVSVAADTVASTVRWWCWTRVCAIGGLAGLAMLVAAWRFTERAGEPLPVTHLATTQPGGQPPRNMSRLRAPVAAAVVPAVVEESHPPPDSVPPSEARSSDRSPFRDVMVSPADTEGFRFLIAAVRSGRFTASEEATDTPATQTTDRKESTAVRIPDEIVIAPLEIAPLVRATTDAESEGEAE